MDSVLAGVFWSHTPTDKLILGLRYTAVMYNNIEFKSATELKPISSGYSFKQCLDYTLESWWTPSSEAIFSLVHIHLYFALVLLNISTTLHEGGRFKLTD